MYEVGRLCVKLAGRDSGMHCLVVDVIDEHFVLIDGQVRRRKCNIRHLEPLDKVLKISKGADHKAVAAALKKEKIEVAEKKPKKVVTEKAVVEEKPAKKTKKSSS